MRIGRVVALTAGLAGAGALVGAVLAVLMLIVFTLPEGVPHLWRDRMFFLFVAGLGAPVGAVLGPIAAWLLMRHVPIGRAIGGTFLGTLAVGTIGLVIAGPVGSLLFGLLGFGAAAVYLRNETPREAGRIDAPADPALLPEVP